MNTITYYFEPSYTAQQLQLFATTEVPVETTTDGAVTYTLASGYQNKIFYTQDQDVYTITEVDYLLPTGQLLYKLTGSTSGSSQTVLATALIAFDGATINLANVPVNAINLTTVKSVTVNGSSGSDSVAFNRPLSNFTVNKIGQTVTVSDTVGTLGTDTLNNVEHVLFSDKNINLTIRDTLQNIAPALVTRLEELYVAFFNRLPDADGLQYWAQQLKGGQTLFQIADSFYTAGVAYSSLTGYSSTMTNSDFVNVVYKNVLGRADGADAEGLAYWTNAIANHSESRGSLVSTILDSAHTFKGKANFGWVADLLDNKIVVADKFAVDLGLNYTSPADSISKTMEIAAAVTPTGTAAAISLIGIPDNTIHLT